MSLAPNDRLLTLPNALSLVRLPLGGLFWVTLAQGPERAELSFGVLAAAAVSDVLDGWVARRRGTPPAGMGSWLDPICDKLFVGSVLAALYVERRAPLSLLALVVTRELLQLPMALVYRTSTTLRRWLRYDFRASLLGKGATVVQFAAVSAILLDAAVAWRLATLAFVLGLLALADYVRRAILIGRRHTVTQEREV
ncbi:MAG TPA: CDP-alcohol phosphatidyltransferase family protein [Polyangia bacterium]|jgi:phosphatidylglycerophosphate synthase|nr:CDP-alcohol phosphatidyltransferase family protein [Polyangia bacterium]